MVKKSNAKKILELKNDLYKKKPVNSRRKGNNFERNVAKKLNTRFDTKEFCRTPGSGAFGTTHKNLPKHLQIYGDLITPESFRYIIECKNGYDVDFEDIFRDKSDLYKFINQAENESTQAGKPWLLIYKKNRQKEILITKVNFPLRKKIVVHDTYNVYLLKDILSLPNEYFID